MGWKNAFRGLVVGLLILVCVWAVIQFLSGFEMKPENLDFDETGPRLVALTALAAIFVASLVFGPASVKDIFKGIFVWGGIMLLLVAGYAYRHDLVNGGYRVLGALAPGLAVEQPDGSIMVVRDASGHFRVNALVDGAPIDFLLDTGASAVVLTSADAQRAGFHPSELSFTVPVSTANGRALVAPIRLDTLQIADARFSDIRGFVAREGALETSLLGMTGLDRLRSWRIEGDRLIMTP
ncbi:aspartyl protease family protein [Roseibium hamelinense]|uniref:Aspartyl protease family protein n=1 Tax=Roseibium hamelinense TaxID=150831 RepID=A0A562T7F8_9HYPH|nr:TIGR02281 family clan AA aspartic protease [Roseibium hamelinense]MTI42063.1 TIGR02281 family clan AA aspartic protease [Roseibium hamelinense]TWI89515.1 aspartyl protease family protein [Roseibium hamelinense]